MQTHYRANRERRMFSWAQGFATLGAALTMAASGCSSAETTEKVLHSFVGAPGDGAFPGVGPLTGSNGQLYGTTGAGGSSDFGTVFKLSPGGTGFTVLHSFVGDSDGRLPYASLIADSAGNLYGTTFEGGGSGCGGSGCGTVFKVAPNGTETVLHSFAGGSDGAHPFAGLIADHAGNLYGTTSQGGGSGCQGAGCGTVFALAPDGTGFKLLHSFAGGPNDGDFPEAGLIANGGALYGTTAKGGGVACGGSGCGTVFKLAPNGTGFTVLHAFAGGPSDGAIPEAGLIADGKGNLYGTTTNGGSGCFELGCGVVFKLAPDGAGYKVLHSFAGGPSDGNYPQASLLADSAGNLYGTTTGGGASYHGTVFKLTPSGTSTVLHSFSPFSVGDGADPRAGLIADSSGNLYGTTPFGGASGDGTVFKLAGTGFVTSTPFTWFKAQLDAGSILSSAFILSSAKSNGIDPVTEPVKIQIGTATLTIPPGSFAKGPYGGFQFEGTIDSVQVKASITPTGALRYAFDGEARGVNLNGTTDPVQVTLTIGNDSGTTSVTPKTDWWHRPRDINARASR